MKWLACLLVLAAGLAHAREPAPDSRNEIEQLFAALAASGCEFNRNGTWYDARRASEHLHRKYDYLLRRGMATTAESFIELAATRSSLSGRPYLVRCEGEAPIPSGAWFQRKLQELRAQPPGAGTEHRPVAG